MKNTFFRIIDLIKQGEITFIVKGVTKRLVSKTTAFGLKRDFNVPFPKLEASVHIKIRSFKKGDEAHFTMDLQNDGLSDKNISTCYIATTVDDVPCYRHWLMSSEQNFKIKEFWGESFPTLKINEALIESVFTIPKYRGQGIMPKALDSVTEIVNELNVRYVMIFVETDNIPSLKGCYRSGFSPYILRTEKWFLLKRTITFKEVPEDIMNAFLKNVRN